MRPGEGACHERPGRLARAGLSAIFSVWPTRMCRHGNEASVLATCADLAQHAACTAHRSMRSRGCCGLTLSVLAAVGVLLAAGTGAAEAARSPGPGSATTVQTAHDDVGISALLEDAGRAQYVRPLEYMDALRGALERSLRSADAGEGGALAPTPTVIRLLQRMGDTALFLKRFDDALTHYRDAHARLVGALSWPPTLPIARELLASHAAVAKALRSSQRWVVRAAGEWLKGTLYLVPHHHRRRPSLCL